jgi:hypothetical protein
MDEPIQVEAVTDRQGRLIPRRFVWRGLAMDVDQTGRRWKDGPWEHTLVMSRDGQTWDLAYSAQLATWRLKGHTAPRSRSLV